MVIVTADSGLTKRAVTEDFELDLEVGLGLDNDFTLSVPSPLSGGDTVWVPGTEFGGVVDDDMPSRTAAGESISYHGRTWRGVIEGFVVRPDPGRSHLVMEGDANDLIGRLLDRCGAPVAMRASPDRSKQVAAYTFPRFCNLLEGITGMLASAGLALSITCLDGSVELSAREPVAWDETLGAMFSARRGHRPVNHLVVLGKGEMEAREVIDLYADESGAISKQQSLFGLDHRGEVYELSNESGAELEASGRKRLAGYQSQRDEIKVSVPPGSGVSIGDTVLAVSARFGIRATAPVTGLVVKAGTGAARIEVKTDGKDR